MTGEHEPRLDAATVAHQLDLLDAAGTVLVGELFGRGPCALHDVWIDDQLLRGIGMGRVEVRDRLRRRLHRGLTGTLSTRVDDDALLGGPKPDHGRSRDGEREDDGQQGLASFVAYGVHSTRRAAAPSTISRGRPTNPSGTAMA